MKIIISGDGEVGFYLAKLLERAYKDITLIDTQKEKLSLVEKSLGIATVLGDSTSYKVLKEAHIESADLLIAVTSNEPANIATCLIGKKLGARYTIARISNMEYLVDKNILNLCDLGIDDLISPESLAAREVKYLLKSPALTETIEIDKGLLNIMGLIIDHQSPLIGKSILETSEDIPDNSFMVAAIHRNNFTLIPNGNTRFLEGDHVYFISTQQGKDQVLAYAGKKNYEIKKILIIGGSRTGKYIALRLNKSYGVKLIEKDLDKCNLLAQTIPNVHIVNGDGTDTNLLQEEKIWDYDAIISVTGNSETNIFTCLIAKEFGVRKNIAMVENIGLFDYSHKMGIDSLINKKLSAANYIFRNIHKGSIFSHLYGVEAEIQEFLVKKNAKVTRRPIKELNFPENAIISGVVRNNNGFITLGNFQLMADDKVFVFSMPPCSAKVNSFFY